MSDAAWLCQLAEAGLFAGELRAAQADPRAAQPDALLRPPRPVKTTQRLVTQLERLGHTVTLQEANAA
jgi:hypothetical protein